MMTRLLLTCATLLAASCAASVSNPPVPNPGTASAMPPLSTPRVATVQQLPRAVTSQQRAAVAVLEDAMRSPNPLERANALEMMEGQIEPLRAMVIKGLVDPNEGVRFAAAMAAARNGLCGLSDQMQPLTLDPSPSVRAAAIAALARCKTGMNQTPLAAMVLSQDYATRANAAMALGEIGNPSAAGLLRAALNKPIQASDPVVVRVSEMELSEALVRLGDRSQLETIRAAFFAPADQGELTALAAQMAGRLKDETLAPAMLAMVTGEGPRKPGPELRLIIADALLRMRPVLAQQVSPLAIEQSTNSLSEVRMLAAAVLAHDASPASEAVLNRLLEDPEPRVRIAAAGAMLRQAGSEAGIR
ncbi:MAG: HEAT repeat domain-containing protein [Phycisphaerales bacterium]|nr:HEAT repeat domain-containing protein [Phycisphaerales bacterium]